MEKKKNTRLAALATVQALLLLNGLFASPARGETDYPISDYQFGSHWSRTDLRRNDLRDPVIARAYRASAGVNGASGLYLGRFHGHHILATAYHVISYPGCELLAIGGFAMETGFESRLSGCLATFKDLDLALITFEVDSPEVEKALKKAAANFAFTQVPEQNEPLLLVGHPMAGNPTQKLKLGQDTDCRIVSKTGEARFLMDPDTVNPNGYASWQIANACDLSHGDSGAALYSKRTGRPVALVSSGTFPVDKSFQDSKLLSEVLARDPEKAWQMNLAVPSFKMREVIEKQLSENLFGEDTAATLRALLADQAD